MNRRKRTLVTTLDPEFVELVEEYRDRVAGSVSDLEVAVMLEATGIGDADSGTYGCRDVFELATRLRAVIGGDGLTAERDLPDWFGSPVTALIRGLTYVLAGVMSMAVARHMHDPWAAPVLLSVSVAATGMMHALSYLAHLVTARNDPSLRRVALRPLLRWCLMIAVAVGVVFGVLDRPLLGVLAALPIVYVASAVMLLVLHKQWLVIGLIVPGGALCLVTLIAPAGGLDPTIAFAVAGAGLGLLLLLAIYETRGKAAKGKVAAIGMLDLRASIDHLLGGLALAGVVGANLLCMASAGQLHHASSRQWFLLALPFFIPLVSAEALVIVFRRGLRMQLSKLDDPARFKRVAWFATVRLWGVQLLLGAAAVGLSLALHPFHLSPVIWGAMGAFLATSTLLLFCLLAGVSGRERMIIGFLAPAILVLLVARAGSEWWHGTRSLTLAIAVLAIAAISFAGRLGVVSSRIEAFR